MMKTKKYSYLFLFFAMSFFLACGTDVKEQTEAEKAKETITEALEGASKEIEGGLGGLVSQIEEAVEGLETGEGTKKKPVNFRKLKELLPEKASGYTRSKAEGESTGAMGFNISKVQANYEDGDKKLKVEIIDAGGVGMAMMGMAAWSMVQIDKESDAGFERTTTYKGNKAFEKCNNSRCEFALFVAGRFLVTSSGRNIKIDDLHDLIEDIGISKLEGMKDDEG